MNQTLHTLAIILVVACLRVLHRWPNLWAVRERLRARSLTPQVAVIDRRQCRNSEFGNRLQT